MRERRMWLVCPRDGRPLSPVMARTVTTTHARRTCPQCRRRFVITIVPQRRRDTDPAQMTTISELPAKKTRTPVIEE